MDFLNANTRNFREFFKTHDGYLKQMQGECLATVNSADSVTMEDEENLCNTGVLNTRTAQGLSFTVFFICRKGFRYSRW